MSSDDSITQSGIYKAFKERINAKEIEVELQRRLFNQLKESGNLRTSAAWYMAEEQAVEFAQMTRQDTNSGTNTNKEISLLEKILQKPEFIRMFKRKKDGRGTIFVDLGCGNGDKMKHVLSEVSKRALPLDFKYFPVDVSPYMIAYAIANIDSGTFKNDFFYESTGWTKEEFDQLQELSKPFLAKLYGYEQSADAAQNDAFHALLLAGGIASDNSDADKVLLARALKSEMYNYLNRVTARLKSEALQPLTPEEIVDYLSQNIDLVKKNKLLYLPSSLELLATNTPKEALDLILESRGKLPELISECAKGDNRFARFDKALDDYIRNAVSSDLIKIGDMQGVLAGVFLEHMTRDEEGKMKNSMFKRVKSSFFSPSEMAQLEIALENDLELYSKVRQSASILPDPCKHGSIFKNIRPEHVKAAYEVVAKLALVQYEGLAEKLYMRHMGAVRLKNETLFDEIRKCSKQSGENNTPGTHVVHDGFVLDFMKDPLDKAVQAAYLTRYELGDEPVIVSLLGQTLGNFDRTERESLVKRIYDGLKPGDYFLVGVELRPDYEERKQAMIESYREGAARFLKPTIDNLRIRKGKLGIEDLCVDYSGDSIEMWFEPKGELIAENPSDPADTIVLNGKIPVATSYKFAPNELPELCRKSGFRKLWAEAYVPPLGQPERGPEYVVVLARK